MRTPTCGIYAIYSTLDGNCLYVGQSKEIEKRFRYHVYKLKGRRSSALKSFVDWYHANGACESLLRLEILEVCENIDLTKNKLEAKWFDILAPRFYGKVPSLSERWDHTEQTRKSIAESVRRAKGNYTGINRPRKHESKPKVHKPKALKTKLPHKKELRDQAFDSEWKEKALRLYDEGKSIRNIARITELPSSSLTRAFHRWGITPKPRTFNGHTHTNETKKVIAQRPRGLNKL